MNLWFVLTVDDAEEYPRAGKDFAPASRNLGLCHVRVGMPGVPQAWSDLTTSRSFSSSSSQEPSERLSGDAHLVGLVVDWVVQAKAIVAASPRCRGIRNGRFPRIERELLAIPTNEGLVDAVFSFTLGGDYESFFAVLKSSRLAGSLAASSEVKA